MSNNYWDKDKNKMRCVWGKCKFNDMTLQIGGFCSH
jgi:hypothetical protein